jgi:ribonuclease HII
MTRKPKPVLDIPPSPNLTFERALWEDDKQWIAGLDEAGRGAWAGPVVAAVVIFPQFANLEQNLLGV